MNDYELYIQNGNNIYQPSIEGKITWETQRAGAPGKLTFNVLKDGTINFQEGNAVKFIVDGANVFFGFVFTKTRSKDGIIKVTAYDQLRYFKNKSSYIYSNKTSSELLTMICNDFKLKCKTNDTKYKLTRSEVDVTLFDCMQTSIDFTLQNTGKLYVLYDDFGNLVLEDIESMKLDIIIDEETGQDFDYKSSIDNQTYNKIRLTYENKKSGKKEVYITQDSKNINRWGVLQYTEKLNQDTNGKSKADALLKLYNEKTRNLSIKNAFGDIRVRAGFSVVVNLALGDTSLLNYMLVEKVKHSFENGMHTMDLTLRGRTGREVSFSA